MIQAAVGSRVLVVDDEGTVRHVLRQILEEQGCEVVDAGSAEEGLSLVDGLAVDVAMLDIVLPGMNGIQLMETIESVSPQTQIIMMTSHASIETTLEAIRHGAYAYLQKPFDELDQIWATVSRAIEKKQLMDLLAQRDFELKKASEASRAKSQFLANMSHELRTPLNAILGFGELLRQRAATVTPEELDVRLQKIIAAGESLLEKITDIIEISNIESGNLEILRADFELRAVIDRIRERFAEPASARGLRLDVTIEPGVPERVAGDAQRLGQILAKLTDNAIRFTKAGTVAVRVSCDETRPDASDLRFEVRDDGDGVTDEARERIFELFTQGDVSPTRAHGGAGLGLAIAKRLVEAMEGTIGVRGSEGSGSTFWFTVPIAAQSLTRRAV
jgi:signal transduction histidine kinase